MKKKFLSYLLLISLLTLTLSTLSSMALYYYVYVESAKTDLRNIMETTSTALNITLDKITYLEKLSKGKKDFRITFLDKDGKVLFDSVKEAYLLETHKDRPEIVKANIEGIATLERYSKTLGKDLYYVTKKLHDEKIIRFSREIDNLFGAFLKILPVNILLALFVFLIASLFAKKITKKTFDPLNNLTGDVENLDIEKFPEVLPFTRKIKDQNLLIKKNLGKIQKEKETIQAILKNMQEGLIIVDEKKNILSINTKALEIFAQKNDLTGKNILHLIREEELLKLLDEGLKGEASKTNISIENKSYKCYLNPFFEEKMVQGVVILFIDETENLRALKMREEFSSNVSHELKTPLTSISGFAELLVNDMVEGKDKKEFYSLIYKDAKRLLNLIEDIMKISSLEKNPSLSEEEVDLREIIEEILKTQIDLIEEKNLALSIEGEGKILANRTLLFELFLNLINNGIKYNKKDGKLDIKIASLEKTYEIKIIDTGIGIPQEALERIFERFYRVDKSRSKKIDGTGLGLAIVKHIIKAVGGDLSVSSQLGTGTTFRVVLKKES